MPKRKKIFYGWWIVLAGAVLNFFTGGTFYYGFSVFFNPIRNTFGWNATATSIAFIFQRFESGVAGPIVGFLVDRVGPRKLMLSGWGIVGLGFLLMSRIDSLWAFYGSFLIIATGFSLGTFMCIYTSIANWFIKKRSRAITLAAAGYGACGILVPLVALSVGQFGWRETLTFIGIALWVIGLPLCLVMRHKPSQYGYLPDGETTAPINEPANTPNTHSSSEIVESDSGPSVIEFRAKAALRTRAFWMLSLTFFFQQASTSAVFIHIVPYLESVEVPTATAAIAVTGMTLGSLIGRLAFGFLGDFTNKRYLIAIALTLQVIGAFVFSFIDMNRIWLLIPFLLTYAPGYGGPIPLRPALLADYFGTRSFGTILGLMSTVTMLGGLVSLVFAGWVFDTTGSYRLAWQLFALVTLPAIPLILLAKPPGAKQEP